MPPRLRPIRIFSQCFQSTSRFTSTYASPRQTRQLSCLSGTSPRPLVVPKYQSIQFLRPSIFHRTLLSVPALANEDIYTEQGLQPLYSRDGFLIAWNDYQTHLVDRLNLLTGGTELENKHALTVAILTSRNSDQAAIFNYASMAHNNHFYFETLTSTKTQPPTELLQAINETFTHIDLMRETFLATALACFSNAFVWLVVDKHRKLRILTTYNAGTPYGQAHRRQSVDTNTTTRSATPPEEEYGGLTGRLANISLPEARDEAELLNPLLCVNVWQHAWLRDYSFEGKERFLLNWWECVDWNIVHERFNPHGKTYRPLMNPLR